MRTVSEELKMLDNMAADFATKELVETREETDKFPYGPPIDAICAKAHEVGFFTIILPEDLGGAAESVTALSMVLDDVCRADASLGGVIFTNALAQEIVKQAGGLGILKEVVSGAATFNDVLLAFPAFNNPGQIENVAEAKEKNGGYELSGSVEYVVLGGMASNALLPAKIKGKEGYSFFLVDLDAKGIDRSEPVLSLGLRACPAVDMNLSGVEGRLVGEEGNGDSCFEGAVDRLSAATAAMALGVMKGSFTDALDYTKQRMQGGRIIVNWSEVRMMLSNMAVHAKVADMIVDLATCAVDGGEPGWALASRAAAIHVPEMACDLTSDGIQLLGGYGYMHDYSQEKRFRDAKQIQSLMGLVPLRKLGYIKRVVDGESPW